MAPKAAQQKSETPKIEKKAQKKEAKRGMFGILKGQIKEAPGDIYNLSL